MKSLSKEFDKKKVNIKILVREVFDESMKFSVLANEWVMRIIVY